jgi:hypothetical protein
VRLSLALVFAAGCAFHPGSGNVTDDARIDGANADGTVDGAAPASLCAADPHLRLCYSFDQSPLPATLPNEGAASVDARLTNVQRLARTDGGAAQLGSTSEIFVPYSSEVANIQAIEIWLRIDTEPANNGRSGLVDSNVTPPNISLFYYRVDPTHQLRCGIGAQTTVWNATLTPGSWMYLACVCDGTNLVMYVDGVNVGTTAGACGIGGAVVADGLTIGSNNNAAAPVNDWLVGAIDGVRLWDTTLTATTVCQTAGKSGC